MRMHKAWTWVGAFGPELMLCAASARVGPARDRVVGGVGRRAAARAHVPPPRPGRRRRPSACTSAACSTCVVEPGAPWAVRNGRRSGRASAPRACTARRSAAPVDLPGLVDESAGRHPRATVVVVVRRRRRAGRRPRRDLEPGRRAARRRRGVRARGLDRRRAARTSRRSRSTASPASATCASARSRTRARKENLLLSPRTTSSRSAVRRRAAGRRRAARRLRRHGAPPRALVTRRSSSSSSFECIAPISSRSGSRPARTISAARSGSTSPEPLDEHARPPLSTSGAQRVAVAQRVVDGEAERLVVAARAEARRSRR